MRGLGKLVAGMALVVAVASPAAAQTLDKKVLSLDAARAIAGAAEAAARRPSKDFEDQIRAGRIAALAIADSTPLQGEEIGRAHV